MIDEDAAERAYEDWVFDSFDDYIRLEEQGYRWHYVGQNVSREMDVRTPYAVVELGEFDVVASKKPILFQWKYGLVAVTQETRVETRLQRIYSVFGDRRPLVISYPNKPDFFGVVHPCTRPTCGWQGSVFDERGPWGHVESDTEEGALRRLIDSYGMYVPEPDKVF